MQNFVRYYEFTFFELDEQNNLTNLINKKISNSVNFRFNYGVTTGVFNTATFYLYNISEDTLNLFTSKKNRRGFYFRACYDDPKNLQNSLIFRGLTYRVNYYREGADLIAEIIASDVFYNLQQASIKTINYPQGVSAVDLLTRISEYLGTFNEVSGTEYLTKKPFYKHPLSFTNVSVITILDMVVADNSCVWSYDITGIKITPSLNNAESNDLGSIGRVPFISRSTGLVGNVKASSLSVQLLPVDYYTQQRLTGNHPIINVTCLLQFIPIQSTVQIECEIKSLNGLYTAISVNYEGEYRGNPWYTNLQLTPQVD